MYQKGPQKQFMTLVHIVGRLTFPQPILHMVVAGCEPATIQFAPGSITRKAIKLVGEGRRFQGSRKSAISRVSSRWSGWVGASISFFYQDQTSEPLRGNKYTPASRKRQSTISSGFYLSLWNLPPNNARKKIFERQVARLLSSLAAKSTSTNRKQGL